MNQPSAEHIRPPAVAGMFYPEGRVELARQVSALLDDAGTGGPRPKALIVPHAGYVYSGAVAAAAYALLRPLRDAITRVVLLGPSHRVPLEGMAVPSAAAFRTPLGTVPVDRAAVSDLLAQDAVREWDAPHAADHALEVQLPFLQTVLDSFSLVPIAVGPCRPQAVAAVLGRLWGGPETLIVVSTDLSHFHPYGQARSLDSATAAAILRRESTLNGEQACGCHALNGLLLCARRLGLPVEQIDLRSSGDTAGGHDRVVGYGSFVVHDD